MLPGFVDFASHHTTSVESAGQPALERAGLWDPPSEKTCRYSRTDTFCTGLVMWCKEVSICVGGRDNPFFGHEESKTPYPCGVCFGVSDPSDW